jgi:putative ABC transport system permease protein
MRHDIEYAFRAVTSAPGAAATAVFILALSIGINAAMVGLIDRALLGRPAQVTEPERLVTLAFIRDDARMATTSYVAYAAVRDDVPAFAGAVAAWQRSSTTVIVDGEQIHADAVLVSGTYFDVLGARAKVGRPVQPGDDRPAADPVIVVSHAFWKSALGGSANVLGRRVIVNGLDYTVSGVMPPGFSGHSPARVDLWIPFSAAMRGSPGWDQEPYRRVASILARLAPAATIAAAATQAGAATNARVALDPLRGADVAPNDRRVAFWLTGVSALVLVIGLANAATLLLVRASRRRRDFAIRTALGASRARLLRQACAEAAIVAVAATAVSLLLAVWFDGAIRQVLLPAVAVAEGTGRGALLAAMVAGAIAAIVIACANAASIPRQLSAGGLEPAFAKASAGKRLSLQTGLLVLQTALSVLLLSGAGMFGRSLYNLRAQDFGIRMDGVVIADVEPGPGARGGSGDLFGDAIQRVRALPGVQQVTPIAAVPFSGFNVPPIGVPGRAEAPSVNGQLPFLQAATPEFFDILAIRILEGRKLTAADDRGAPVVVVNETMARSVWPGESAVGKCIRIGFDPNFDPETATGPPIPSGAVPCREVVGVAGDMRQRSLLPADGEDRLMQYFVPFSQVPVPPFIPNPDRRPWGLMLHTEGDVAALAPAIRKAIVGTRTDVPFVRVRPYSQLLDRQIRPWRLGTVLFGLFSGLALCVGAIGLYAAFAHAVTVRRREMAIRMAIGAAPRGVVAMILREALIVAGAGLLGGWAAAVVGGRRLGSLLFETSPADPLVLGSTGVLMLAVAIVATLLPAWSASRVNPSALLRS